MKNLIRFNSNLQKWRTIEWVFFFVIIPAIFILIFLLPQNYKDSFFILNPQHLFYPSLLLNAITHSTSSHLLGNLGSYLVVMFLIFNFETNKKYFYYFLVVLFIPITIILSIISMQVLPTYTGQGASGITAGLMGYSVYASYKYFRDVQKIKLNTNFIWLIFLINAICLWYYLPHVVNQLLFWIIGVAIILLIFSAFYLQITGFKQMFIKIQNIVKNLIALNVIDHNSLKNAFNSSLFFIYWIILISCLMIEYTGLILLVPSNPWQGGGLTNTIVHYIGFIFGLFAPIIFDFFSYSTTYG